MSYNIYPVTYNYLDCDDYKIKVNGKEVQAHTARVSAVPFNTPWPGHQRQLSQTEIVQFISLETDEELLFEITPTKPFTTVKIRPQSLGITPEIIDNKIIFKLKKSAYFTVEAYGRNNALHIFADPISNYSINKTSNNVLYFGKGVHDVDLIEMKSNQTIFIDEGAVVFASIKAVNCENIKILGRGILDNSKNIEKYLPNYEKPSNNDVAVPNAIRTHAVQFNFCNNVMVEGITIRDSLLYNICPACSTNINIANVKLIGNWRYNSDGFDMHNCINVHIKNCFVRTFDDSICMKGLDFNLLNVLGDNMQLNGKKYDVFKNVLVEDCVVWNDWGHALEIGAETRATEISNITFRNCDVIHTNHHVIDCKNAHQALVKDLTYKNINVECDEKILPPQIQNNDSEIYVNPDPNYMPYTISANIIYYQPYSMDYEKERGRNKNIKYENINLIADRPPKCRILGYDKDHCTENVTITNLMWNGVPIEKLDGENWVQNEFTSNIKLDVNPYIQLGKNTVNAKNQLNGKSSVQFINPNGNGIKIMFVGNSITLHGVLPEIGWYNECGMAASSEENDYVHLIKSEITKSHPNASYCICQVADWERNYKNGEDILSQYSLARNYSPDIIIVRCLENCPIKDFDGEKFIEQIDKLLSYLDKSKTAHFIYTTGFFNHPAEKYIIEYANYKKQNCIILSDLGEKEEMKAIGKFNHSGVANHPGDLGMKTIANRILDELNKLL